ncbi:MAG: hypothetical protein Q8P48_00615 [Deltaproteobacteria bacterium]|nr:hypothetical protein [Deltaproteobacteria bacterium]
MHIFQHYFNSMHVFCRLRALGFGRDRAIRLCRVWERLIHPLMYCLSIKRRGA